MSTAIWKALAEAAPLLSVDLDGVLAHLTEVSLAVVNSHFGTDFTSDQIRHYWLSEAIGVEPAAYLDTWFKSGSHYADLPADPVGVAVVRQAKREGREVWIASDRPADALPFSAQWLRRHGVPYDRLLMRPGIKDEIAKSERHVVFLDDDPFKAQDLIGPTTELVLIRRPWTNIAERDGLRIVDTWGQVCDALGVGYPSLSDLVNTRID